MLRSTEILIDMYIFCPYDLRPILSSPTFSVTELYLWSSFITISSLNILTSMKSHLLSLPAEIQTLIAVYVSLKDRKSSIGWVQLTGRSAPSKE